MKPRLTFLTFGLTLGLILSCDNSAKTVTSSSKPDNFDRVDDSTVCHYYNQPDKSIDMFYITNKDTTMRIRYTANEFYTNYVYLDESRHPIKIKQYVKPNDTKDIVNEILFFKQDGSLDTLKSHLLRVEILKDSIQLHSDNSNIFNLTRVLTRDTKIFDRFQWTDPLKFETRSTYIKIPKTLSGQKCVFQRIEIDKNGKELGGYDIYFDVDNLICRDIRSSLICQDKH